PEENPVPSTRLSVSIGFMASAQRIGIQAVLLKVSRRGQEHASLGGCGKRQPQKKGTSRSSTGTFRKQDWIKASYWFGKSSRVQPVVLTSRNNGVRGGNNAGVRKLVSKL